MPFYNILHVQHEIFTHHNMRKMHTNEQNVFFAPYSPVTNNRSASIRSAHCKSTIHMACKAGYFDVVESIQFECSICEWNNSFRFCRTMWKIGKSTVIRYSFDFVAPSNLCYPQK